ncbi:MAG: hypothetical protein AABX82_07855, partial [Nanoarchaeota archaeon]
ISPAALLYHGLTKYAGVRRGFPEDVAKVEEAVQYMTDLQRGIIEQYYAKNNVAWRIESRFGITQYAYLRERKAAEAIVKAVIAGTYQPIVAGEEQRAYAEEDTVEKPAVAITWIPKSKRDLYRRMAEYRALHGTKEEEEEPAPELEGERLYYATRQSKTVASLEDALQKSHAQAAQIKKLGGKALPDDFARIVNGDATIDFLIRDECYAVAAAYAHDVYARAREGMVWPISDQEIQKEEKDDPKNKEKRIKKKEQEVRAAFIAAYDTYAAAPSEETLIALFKGNLRLSRGYIATVGWYFATKERTDEKRKSDFVGDQWKYKPTWKDAWKFFVPDEKAHRKKRDGNPVLLTDPVFGAYVAEGETERVLRRRYLQIWHHAETARGSIVTKYDAFVMGYAKKLDWAKMPFDDKISLGKEGLLRASQKYDP